MARRGRAYPQVDGRAAGMVNAAVATVPATVTASQALTSLRKRGDAALALRGAEPLFVTRDDLARAEQLGLGELAAERLSRPLPIVAAGASEVMVRRRLAEGAPLVIVRNDGAYGAIAAGAGAPHGVGGPSMRRHLARSLTVGTLAVLRRAGAIAEGQGGRAFLVGGVVRDAIDEVSDSDAQRPRDLDVVVEGDAPTVARLLAAEVGGTLVEHQRFLTASVQWTEGRIDLATARSERYALPGALPTVLPSGILQDLRRRDFTLNAMALELSSGAFGLLDIMGGRVDLAQRRLRILHPLSFVEDPTRIFRSARYAARLGLGHDAWTARCQSLALDLAPYAALSGQRLMAELERMLREHQAERAIAKLGAVGAFRLVDMRYRFTRTTSERLAALPAASAWAAERGCRVAPLELLLLVLLGDQPHEVTESALRRLGITGERETRLARALAEAPALTDRLRSAATPSALARALRGRTAAEIAWIWLSSEQSLRAALDDTVARSASAAWLTGDDVIALGVRPGPDVARVLGELRAAQLDDVITDRAAAVAFVERRASTSADNDITAARRRREG